MMHCLNINIYCTYVLIEIVTNFKENFPGTLQAVSGIYFYLSVLFVTLKWLSGPITAKYTLNIHS